MICEKCKKEIDNDSNFCKYCGSLIEKEEVEIISINVKDIVRSKDFIIKLRKDSTYRDFLNYLFSKRFIKFSKKVYATIKLYSDDGSICFRDNELKYSDKSFNNEKLDDYFVDNCSVFIYYDEDDFIDMRNFVCLYGCPTSKKIKLNTKIKDGNL